MSDITFDFWAVQRPITGHWGSGQVLSRLEDQLGTADVIFGHTDGPVNGIHFIVDRTNGYEWASLPFPDNTFHFGYWDPPYDHLYKKEGIEIWRTCKKLAILHTHIWPISWLKDAKRVAMIAITMGPMKRIRCLQVFEKRPDEEIAKNDAWW